MISDRLVVNCLYFIVLFFCFFSFIECNSKPVCVCNCCVPRSGACLSETEGNFTVDSCQDDCTEEVCKNKFSICRIPGANIQTTCSNSVSKFDTLLITLSLLLIVLLTVLSTLQYKSKVIRAIFPIQVAKTSDRGTQEHVVKSLIRNEEVLRNITENTVIAPQPQYDNKMY